MRHRLFAVEDLAPGELRRVQIEGVAVVVVRKPDGCVRALRDICPHRGARLSSGWITPLLEGDDVDALRLSESIVLRCPWHGYEFDVDTGLSVADPEHVRIKSYCATVHDGQVVVDR